MQLNTQLAMSLPLVAAVGLAIVFPLQAHAQEHAQEHEKQQENPYSQSDYGGVGLIQMPSARMNSEGDFSFNYVDNQEFRRWSVNLQLFPWLETTVRYTDLRYLYYGPDRSFSNQTLKDKGIDLKLRLLQESRYLPQVSVGMRDLGGTGLYSGEYLAANKQWGPLDFTVGMGWGYLGARGNLSNPFCQVADRFCQRTTETSGRGGQFEVDDWFRGNAAWFAGVEYQTPWQPLSLKLEYESNDYSQEQFNADALINPELTEAPLYQDSPWNIGAVYELHNNVRLKLNYERGNTLSFGVTLRTDFNDANTVKVTPKKRPAVLDQQKQEPDAQRLAQALKTEAGYSVNAMDLTDNRLTVYTGTSQYRSRDEALERAARVIASELPSQIKRYELVQVTSGMAINSDNIDAQQFNQVLQGKAFSQPLSSAYYQGEGRAAKLTNEEDWWLPPQTDYPNWSASVQPRLTQSVGSAEDLYLYQIAAEVNGGLRLSPSWQVNASVGINILNNYDKFTYTQDPQDTPLPRVRTQIREYYDDSNVWLNRLYSRYSAKIAKDWYGSAYVGYLERMFAGAGSEILYRPMQSNWAFGADINWVKQRGFDDILKLRDYDVWTGHVSAYWQTPYLDDSVIKLHAGRFLAGDEGVQTIFEHKFDSGIIAGAFASFTNVSAEEYGEGSFTKGLYISIPFDVFSITPSRNRAAVGWSPITRDGGQRLSKPSNLYMTTDSRKRFYNEN